MPQKVKEEERIEKIIRGLLKLPENRRCINCNSLGPQYVCTTFWTFVCTTCSGVHREFTHRVKSVSMAKFSAEEVSALQAGGNERARQIYFKAWDPHRNSFPDGSNLHRIRDFIKNVYIHRKYAGGRSTDKLSMLKADARDDYQQRPSFEASSFGGREDFFESRSFRVLDNARRDDFFERNSFENPLQSRRNDDRSSRSFNDERNSPRYRQKSAGHGARTARFEIVDDRFREDTVGSVKKFEIHRHSNEESRGQNSSPVSQRSSDSRSHPAIRPLRLILGEKAPPLNVGESPKADGSPQVRMAGISNNPPAEKKVEETKTLSTLSSLIDFDNDPEPAATSSAVVQTQKSTPVGDGGNMLVPSSRTENVSSNPSNSLETLLFGLAGPVGDTPSVATSGSSTTDIGCEHSHMENSNPVPSNASSMQVERSGTVQQSLPSASPAENSSSTAQQSDAPKVQQNQPSLNIEPSNAIEPQTTVASEQSLQVASKAAAQGPASVTQLVPGGRQELPVDFFSSSYSSFGTAVPVWQSRPPYGMGYGTQYQPTSMPVGAPPNSVKSMNPFDIGDNGHQLQATMFPSMSSVQGALPNASLSPSFQSQASLYGSPRTPQGPYGMMMQPGAYMGLQSPNNMHPSRPQGVNSNNDAAFASLNPIHQQSSGGGGNNHDSAFRLLDPNQQQSGVNPSSAASNPYSSTGGNPFG